MLWSESTRAMCIDLTSPFHTEVYSHNARAGPSLWTRGEWRGEETREGRWETARQGELLINEEWHAFHGHLSQLSYNLVGVIQTEALVE